MWNGGYLGVSLKLGFGVDFILFFLFISSWLNWGIENISVCVELWAWNNYVHTEICSEDFLLFRDLEFGGVSLIEAGISSC